MSKQVILYDSDEACVKGIARFEDGSEIPIFKAGKFPVIYTEDEHLARYHGSTHRRCPETGEIFEKSWTHGPTVRARRQRERYFALKQVEGDFPIFWGEEWIYDLDELLEYAVNNPEVELDDVRFARPCNFRTVDQEDITGEAPEECDRLDDVVAAKLKELNEAIEEAGTQYWEASNTRPTDKQMAEWKAMIDDARQKVTA